MRHLDRIIIEVTVTRPQTTMVSFPIDPNRNSLGTSQAQQQFVSFPDPILLTMTESESDSLSEAEEGVGREDQAVEVPHTWLGYSWYLARRAGMGVWNCET